MSFPNLSPTSHGRLKCPLDKTSEKITRTQLFLVWIDPSGLSQKAQSIPPTDPKTEACAPGPIAFPTFTLTSTCSFSRDVMYFLEK